MKVLIACEESQRTCTEFRKLGHEAYSCDVQEPSGGHPEWHILGDAVPILRGGQITTMDGITHDIGQWDLLIAHPPCTYLSNAGARHLWKNHQLQPDRMMLGIQGRDLFMRFWWADIPRIAVENPVPTSVYCLPKYTQVIEPYQFGHPFKKKTCLWLKNLPELKPTNEIPVEQCQSTKVAGNWYNKGGKDRQKNRSKTFIGISKAMAEQWGGNNETD